MQILPLILYQVSRTFAKSSLDDCHHLTIMAVRGHMLVKVLVCLSNQIYDLRATDVATAKSINMQPLETLGKSCIWERFDYGMTQLLYMLCNTPSHFANRTLETAPRSYTSQPKQIVCQHEARIAGSLKG
jgi:hypothetical protein